MTANEPAQNAEPEPDSDPEDDGWVSLSERPFTPHRPPEDEGRNQGAEGHSAPPPPPETSPPDPEDDGWISLTPGTLPPPRPAPEHTPPRPTRAVGTRLALDFRGLGGQLLLNRGQTVRLGRSRSWATPEAAEILADEPTVSGQHASVEYAEDGTVWLTEVAEGSTNGIRVNRHQVLTPGHRLRIHTGDTVWLGPHIDFLIRGGPPPTPDDADQPPGT
ncbi:FHA domain-containing protein [Streptomyces sp. NPDC127091]|uniref:FHA domain-containing protein n=1 Tax=Streptomyces sp. NPDC127091 TaxID=3347134 RepID=UPI00364BC54C